MGAEHQVDIALFGGGLVGSALGNLLLPLAQQARWRMAIIDANEPAWDDHPSFDDRSTALAYASKSIFESMGLWETVQPKCAPIDRIIVSSRGQWGKTRLAAADYQLEALGWVAPNKTLGQALWQPLQSNKACQLYLGEKVEAILPLENGYVLRWPDGRLLKTKLLLIVDGYPSFACQQLGIGHELEPYQQNALVANLEFSQPHLGQAFERFTESGPMALLPLVHSRQMAMVLTRANPQPDPQSNPQSGRQSGDHCEWEGIPSPAWVEAEVIRRFGGSMGRLLKVGTMAQYPLARILTQEAVRYRSVVLGNAAHLLHPVAGQGFNLALRDLVTLTRALGSLDLDDSTAVQVALRQYQSNSHWDQYKTVGVSHWLPRGFESRCSAIQAARSLMLNGLNLAPRSKFQFAKQMMGMSDVSVRS